MMQNSDLLDTAYKHPVPLNNISSDPLIDKFMKKIIDFGEILTFSTGQVIFESGTVLKTAYVIKSGNTKSFRVTVDGTEFTYWDNRIDNDFTIGFPSVLVGCPVSVSVMATTHVELAAIGKAKLLELIMEDPLCAIAISRLMSSKFINTSENMHLRTEESNKKRFYSMLLKLAVGGECVSEAPPYTSANRHQSAGNFELSGCKQNHNLPSL